MSDYFVAGNLLHIKNYQFEDGGKPKDKFLLVVCLDELNSFIIRALPTKQDHVPDDKIRHGCTNSSDGLFSYFMFEAKRVVCENGFGFDLNTFVYFAYNVQQTPIANFLNYFSGDIQLKGKLTEQEYKRFIKCLKSSRHIPRSIKAKVEALVSND